MSPPRPSVMDNGKRRFDTDLARNMEVAVASMNEGNGNGDSKGSSSGEDSNESDEEAVQEPVERGLPKSAEKALGDLNSESVSSK